MSRRGRTLSGLVLFWTLIHINFYKTYPTKHQNKTVQQNMQLNTVCTHIPLPLTGKKVARRRRVGKHGVFGSLDGRRGRVQRGGAHSRVGDEIDVGVAVVVGRRRR